MMATHLFSYRFKGDEYSLEVEADTPGEARQKHYAMATARYDGELKAKVKVLPNWIGRLFG